jgi:hypothetical protein
MGGKLGGKFCSAIVLLLRPSMGHPKSGNSTRLGQGFSAVSRRGGSRRMGGMVTQMLKVGAGI